MRQVETQIHRDTQDRVLSTLGEILSASISLLLPRDRKGQSLAKPHEVAAISQLCTMGALPSGSENPKYLMRSISDRVLDRISTLFHSMRKDPVASKICHLFIVEWCFRHDFLHGDWEFEWESHCDGAVRYSPKIPLDQAIRTLDHHC